MNLQKKNESRDTFKKKFNFRELYRSLVFFPRAMLQLIKNNKSELIDKNFIERLQLAVTEVSGCPACSYQHTKIALRQGMSNEEILSFLSGGDKFIKLNETKAIMFAQHFAESRGYPKEYAYKAIVAEYGEDKAKIILSATQVIISGNMYGIAYSAFQARLKGKPYKESSLLYELKMLVGGVIILPLAFLQAMTRSLFGLENKRLDKSKTDN